MNRQELTKLYPLLRILSKLTDVERQVIAHYLTYPACDGIYECVQTSLVNHTVPTEQRKQVQQHYRSKTADIRSLLANPPKAGSKRASEKNKFDKRRKKAIVNVADDLGLIFKTSLPLIKKYVGAEDSDDDNDDDNNSATKGEPVNQDHHHSTTTPHHHQH